MASRAEVDRPLRQIVRRPPLGEILGKQSLSLSNFRSKRILREHITAFMASWNRSPTPFEWTKPARATYRPTRELRTVVADDHRGPSAMRQ